MSGTLKPPPAPFDARQLADTLDTMGLLVASLSDRIDAQGRMLEQVLKTATEARAAAFAAEKATDWERNGDLINEGIARGTRQVNELVEVINNQLEIGNDVFELMKPLLGAVDSRDSPEGSGVIQGCLHEGGSFGNSPCFERSSVAADRAAHHR